MTEREAKIGNTFTIITEELTVVQSYVKFSTLLKSIKLAGAFLETLGTRGRRDQGPPWWLYKQFFKKIFAWETKIIKPHQKKHLEVGSRCLMCDIKRFKGLLCCHQPPKGGPLPAWTPWQLAGLPGFVATPLKVRKKKGRKTGRDVVSG